MNGQSFIVIGKCFYDYVFRPFTANTKQYELLRSSPKTNNCNHQLIVLSLIEKQLGVTVKLFFSTTHNECFDT